MSAIFARNRYGYMSKFEVSPIFFFVLNTILFSVGSKHHEQFTRVFPTWFAMNKSTVFLAQSLSGLIIIQGCAGEATCIFGQFPFRPFQKLSDSQLQGFDAAIPGAQHGKRKQPMNSFWPNKCWFHNFDILSSSNFPCPGIKHEIRNFPVPKRQQRILFRNH